MEPLAALAQWHENQRKKMDKQLFRRGPRSRDRSGRIKISDDNLIWFGHLAFVDDLLTAKVGVWYIPRGKRMPHGVIHSNVVPLYP